MLLPRVMLNIMMLDQGGKTVKKETYARLKDGCLQCTCNLDNFAGRLSTCGQSFGASHSTLSTGIVNMICSTLHSVVVELNTGGTAFPPAIMSKF